MVGVAIPLASMDLPKDEICFDEEFLMLQPVEISLIQSILAIRMGLICASALALGDGSGK